MRVLNRFIRILPLAALFFTLLVGGVALAAGDAPLGEAARQRAEELANSPAAADPQAALQSYLTAVWVLTGLVALMLLIMVQNVLRLTGFNPFATWQSNVINPALLLLFLFAGALGIAYEWHLHAKYALVGNAASEHGVEIDNMLITSLVVTGIAFVIVQVLLFVYAFLYRGRPGQRATFFHDSKPLELGLAGLTALGLAFLVLGGLRVWSDINATPKQDALAMELVGEQFQWRLRYGGKDNQLGKANYKLIGADNVLGVDYADAAAKDDIIPADKNIVLPVGRQVHLSIRAKDVLHGVYMPHFRVQMYAVPGMPTQFTFTPTVTTADMKSRTGNEKFEYEMACSQLCGAGHYNMKMTITVVSQAEYDKIAAGWKPAFDPAVHTVQPTTGPLAAN